MSSILPFAPVGRSFRKFRNATAKDSVIIAFDPASLGGKLAETIEGDDSRPSASARETDNADGYLRPTRAGSVTPIQARRVGQLAKLWLESMWARKADSALAEANLHDLLKSEHLGQGFVAHRSTAFWVNDATPSGRVNRLDLYQLVTKKHLD